MAWTSRSLRVAILLNIANSGADVFININFGNDAVQSIKQAKQFGVLAKMTLVIAYNTPFPGQGCRRRRDAGGIRSD